MRPNARGPETTVFRMAFQRAAFAVIGVGLLVLAACTPLYRDHGFAPTDAELAVLTVGKDDRETVAKAVGRPSASGLLDDTRWYYVQSRYKQRGPFAPEEIERQVVVITFAESGTVSNIERFGLEDGQVVEDGPHAELLRKGGLYARFWARQSGGFIGLDEEAAE